MSLPGVAEPRPAAGPGRGRVLHLITRLDRGGSADNTLLTCMGLARRGWDVTLAHGATRDPSPKLAELTGQGAVRRIDIPSLVRSIDPVSDARAYRTIRSLLRRGDYDLVHTHSSKAGILGRHAARGLRCRVVHTPHGHVFDGYFNRATTALFVSLERRAARWCDRIVVLTDKGREDHLARGVGRTGQFATIPSGVDLEQFRLPGVAREVARAAFGLPEDGFVVGCVARLVPVKGQRYLLEAAERLVDLLPSLRVMLVGDGEDRDALEARAASPRLDGRVLFTGTLSDPRPALAAMDLVALPSLNEGQGRAAVEAMAAGLPVIASEVGGLPEVLDGGRAGVLVPAGDPEALAREVKLLASSPADRSRLTEAGRRRAERYSDTAMLDATESVYSDLLGHFRCQARLSGHFEGA